MASCTIVLILNQIISSWSIFFFYLALNQVIEVTAFIEGLDQVSKPIREYEKCAITVVTKISTCNQRYKSTLQMAFKLQ